MTQPPYGYGPNPGAGQPYGTPPGYRQPIPPQQSPYPPRPYPQQSPYPPGYGGAPGYRPPAPYGPPGLPPRRRRSPAARVIAALVAIVVVVLVRGVVAAGFNSVHSNDSSNFSYAPTTGAPAPPGSTGDNPLLAAPGATLAAAKCAYSPWSSTDVDVARKFFEAAASCLQNEWQPVLAADHISFTPPKLNVTATTAGVTTKCTGNSNNFAAFYCGADQTIYMPLSQLQTDMFGNHWEIYLSVFAHEYGHHVQALAGILSTANKQRRDAGATSSAGLEISRRIELQANCFDGMYLASSTTGGGLNNTQARNARQDAYGRGDAPGDMRDHGTAQHMGDWWSTGFDKNKSAQCNTFTASAGDVS